MFIKERGKRLIAVTSPNSKLSCGNPCTSLSAKFSLHHSLRGHGLFSFLPEPFYPALNTTAPSLSRQVQWCAANLQRLSIYK